MLKYKFQEGFIIIKFNYNLIIKMEIQDNIKLELCQSN
jgi:hypothetical protein